MFHILLWRDWGMYPWFLFFLFYLKKVRYDTI
nr:MAG TPA: hypothetical protein [Crassvirales sp.]